MQLSIQKLHRDSMMLLFFLLTSTFLHGQTTLLNGSVVDVDEQPIIGATILADSGAAGAISDQDGNFTLELEGQGPFQITISYLGYKTIQQAIDGKTNMEFIMEEDVSRLEELVVIGYGNEKRSNMRSHEKV